MDVVLSSKVPAGPLDRRRGLTRCDACRASHLKCSGGMPCHSCVKKGLACNSPDSKFRSDLVIVQNHRPGRKTLTTTTRSLQILPICKLIATHHLDHIYYFDLFSIRNDFTGKSRTCGDEVKALRGRHSKQAAHLYNAMLAIGALYETKMLSGKPPSLSRKLSAALEYYTRSVSQLRVALQTMTARVGEEAEEARLHVLWTTLLLGLFELMNDVTGVAWRSHMIFGTSQALQAGGPASCISARGMAFFRQARIFETCRTILFNESSFLTEPGWMELSKNIGDTEHASPLVASAPRWYEQQHPLDILLDITVNCSGLRVRVAKFIHEEESGHLYTNLFDAETMCEDGHNLREALYVWNSAYGHSSYSDLHLPTTESSTLISLVFFAAVSIYLSGIFDYEIQHWHRFGLKPAILDGAVVQNHVTFILDFTTLALDLTNTSPLLFLFPLRIAGARARSQHQKDRISILLKRVQLSGFVVASTIQDDLQEVYSR